MEKQEGEEDSPRPPEMLTTGLRWCTLSLQPAPQKARPRWRPGLWVWSDKQDAERDVGIPPTDSWAALIALDSPNPE